MAKIAVVEDWTEIAQGMKKTLEAAGHEVTLATATANYMPMPEREEIINKILWADIVLLDYALRRNEKDEEYRGTEFLEYCNGKRLIGISDAKEFGKFNIKKRKSDFAFGKAEKSGAAEELLTLVDSATPFVFND